MGLVAVLILVDLLVLTFWNLTDPIRCSRSVAAAVKVEWNSVGTIVSTLCSKNRIRFKVITEACCFLM